MRFEERPAMGRVYARALTQRRPRYELSAGLPLLRSVLAAQTLTSHELDAYRAACGARGEVPVGFPQMLITPVHIALITSDAFPIRAMGLVHPRFSITQRRALRAGEQLTFETWFDGLREVHNGVEFDIRSEARVDGELVWESVAATFHRLGNERQERVEAPIAFDESRPFEAPSDAGRRYARVSGDYNPVHLHPVASRLFGFKRPIAHGWWLVARCLAELGVDGADAATTYSFEFRRPVLLGDAYELRTSADASRFAVVDGRGKYRLVGELQPGTSGTAQ